MNMVKSLKNFIFTLIFNLNFKILVPIVTETWLGSPRLVIEIRSGSPRLVIEIRTGSPRLVTETKSGSVTCH